MKNFGAGVGLIASLVVSARSGVAQNQYGMQSPPNPALSQFGMQSPTNPAQSQFGMQSPTNTGQSQSGMQSQTNPAQNQYGMQSPTNPTQNQFGMQSPTNPTQNQFGMQFPTNPTQNQFGLQSPTNPTQNQFGMQFPTNPTQNQFGMQSPTNPTRNQFEMQSPTNPTRNQFGMQSTNPAQVQFNSQNSASVGANFRPSLQDDANLNPEAKELFAQAVKLLKTNRAYQARELLERAAQIAPKSAEIHCNLGLAYQNSGNMQKALTEFKLALTYNPSMPEAKLNLAGCYQSLGANKDAITWYSAYLLEKNTSALQRKQIGDIIAALKQAGSKTSADPKAADYIANVTADGAFRWSKEKLPIKVFIQTSVVNAAGNAVPGFKASFRDALNKAFEEWCAASNDRIAFVTVPTVDQADIFCTWTADPQEVTDNGTSSERGTAKVIVKGNNIERATLKILTRPALEDGELSQDELMKACLHEVGHVLGLQGHSPNNHDVMFFTVDTATVWPVLSRRDKATIAKLYDGYPPRPLMSGAKSNHKPANSVTHPGPHRLQRTQHRSN